MGKTVLQNNKWHKTQANNSNMLACGGRVTPTNIKPTALSLRKYCAICSGCKAAFAA